MLCKKQKKNVVVIIKGNNNLCSCISEKSIVHRLSIKHIALKVCFLAVIALY